MSQAIKTEIKGDEMIITVPLANGVMSSSGKSLTVASSRGAVDAGEWKGKSLKLNLNVYTPAR